MKILYYFRLVFFFLKKKAIAFVYNNEEIYICRGGTSGNSFVYRAWLFIGRKPKTQM